MIIKTHKSFLHDKLPNTIVLYGLFILSILLGAGTVGVLTARNTLAVSTNSWTGTAGDHLWSTANNWSLDHVPASDEAVSIDPSVDTTISVSQDINVASIKAGATSSKNIELDMSANNLTTGNVDFENGAALKVNSVHATSINITGGIIVINSLASNNGVYSSGDITINKNALGQPGRIVQGSTQSFPITAANLNVGSGTIVHDGSEASSAITVSGNLTNSGTININSIHAGSLTNAGTVTLGPSGDMTVDGDWSNNSTGVVGTSYKASITAHGNVNNSSSQSQILGSISLHIDDNLTNAGTISISDISVGGKLTNSKFMNLSSSVSVTGNLELGTSAEIHAVGDIYPGGAIVMGSQSTMTANNLTIDHDLTLGTQTTIAASNNLTINHDLTLGAHSVAGASNTLKITGNLTSDQSTVSVQSYTHNGNLIVTGNIINDDSSSLTADNMTVNGSLTNQTASTLTVGNINVNGQFDNINGVINNSTKATIGGDFNVSINDGKLYNIALNALTVLHNLNFTNCSKVNLGDSTSISGDMRVSSSTLSVKGSLSVNSLTSNSSNTTINSGLSVANGLTNANNSSILIDDGTSISTIQKDLNNDDTSSFGTYGNITIGGDLLNKNTSDNAVSINETTLSGSNGDNINVTGPVEFGTLIIPEGKTLTLEAGSTQTIYNDFEANGSYGKLIKIRSSVAGQQANLDIQDTYNVSYVDVQDNNNLLGAYLEPENSIDSGNNSYWFAGYYEITSNASNGGNIASDKPLTKILTGNNRTVKIAPNTGYKIVNVTVDSAALGPVDHYTFTDIRKDHSIAATFALDTTGITTTGTATTDNHQTTTPLTPSPVASEETTSSLIVDKPATTNQTKVTSRETSSAKHESAEATTTTDSNANSKKTPLSTAQVVTVAASSVIGISIIALVIRKLIPLIIAAIGK